MNKLPAKRLYFTLRHISEMSGVEKKTLYRLCKSGRMAYTIADDESNRPTIYVPRADVEQFLGDLEARTVRGPVRHTVRARPIPMNPHYRAG